MKRTLLTARLAGLAALLTLAVIGGAVKEHAVLRSPRASPSRQAVHFDMRQAPITISKVRPVPIEPMLPAPNLGDHPLFTPRDVVPISGSAR